ncbi:MAG TPA: protein kinase [Longimicrobiaceae bacterium]|nr:protein kinase [Longimicrobiaceae bacterium]
MAKKLKEGDEINGYRITRVIGPGAMAISYDALGPSGQRVFFKQYKSPAVTVEWYRGYVQYQKELHRRIEESPARNYCVRAIDAFEAVWGGRNYFQVFEFVENGADLAGIFERERSENGGRSPSVPFDARLWEQHVIWAKVFMSGINTLHAAKIAHADLKPENAYLIEDRSIAAGFQLKLIDLDFSVLTDRTAPWHGHQGYVGTDNYRSPEHFTAGATPGAASDVFTSGLILYQLLAGRHPYWAEDQAEYARRALAHAADRPALGGVMPAPASNEAVADVLYRCLAPRPEDRPTAAEVRDVLTGRSEAGPVPAAAATPAPAAPVTPAPAGPAAEAAPAPAPAPAGGPVLRSERIRLVGESGHAITVGVRTPLGKHMVRQFGEDFNVWDTEQCAVERGPDGAWQVVPNPGTTNETLLNGETLTGPSPLREGDVIAVGRAAKGVAKLPLTARSG